MVLMISPIRCDAGLPGHRPADAMPQAAAEIDSSTNIPSHQTMFNTQWQTG